MWAFFVACIIAIPFAAIHSAYGVAALLTGVVGIEVLVLFLHSWQCPLTAVAGRYTTERRANFDIYLPEWLARHNQTIFGTLYVAGVLFTLVRWARS
ncbi:hypothetical protein [Prosthecobacter sp.]|uniref:hypothetical protein n=1 Tax=Prosthecobacter sp. TaxID=1965333 RepID=UPI003BAF0F8C